MAFCCVEKPYKYTGSENTAYKHLLGLKG